MILFNIIVFIIDHMHMLEEFHRRSLTDFYLETASMVAIECTQFQWYYLLHLYLVRKDPVNGNTYKQIIKVLSVTRSMSFEWFLHIKLWCGLIRYMSENIGQMEYETPRQLFPPPHHPPPPPPVCLGVWILLHWKRKYCQ